MESKSNINSSYGEIPNSEEPIDTFAVARRYKNNRRIILILTIVFFFLCVGTLLAKYKYMPVTYMGLSNNETLETKIACDSSGNKIIAIIKRDSSFQFILSIDSGFHFDAVGKSIKYQRRDTGVVKLSFAPDNQSIVAVSHFGIYVKTFDADSFVYINGNGNAGNLKFITGFSFVPNTDTIYVYGYNETRSGTHLIAINYRKLGEILAYKITDEDWGIEQLAFENGKILAAAYSFDKEAGILSTELQLTDPIKYNARDTVVAKANINVYPVRPEPADTIKMRTDSSANTKNTNGK